MVKQSYRFLNMKQIVKTIDGVLNMIAYDQQGLEATKS